jgi:hypothetical protein
MIIGETSILHCHQYIGHPEENNKISELNDTLGQKDITTSIEYFIQHHNTYSSQQLMELSQNIF